MAKSLDQKVAIVTGAASGIGRAIAYQFGVEGARLVLSDLNDAGGRETFSHLRDRGVEAVFVHADTSVVAENEALVATAVSSFGRLDIAVNNAGIGGQIAPIAEYSVAGWDKVIAVNLSGVFYGMRYQIPAMLAHGQGGSIINITSILGQVGFRNSAAYVSAKHGIVGLTKTAALEYGPQKIRVNAVAPGFIKTPMVENALTPDALQMLAAMHALGRIGEAPEVAELVTWLASDKASFATGGYFPIDGGYLAQ